MLCVGPTGTGKTLTASDKLLRKMPKSYLSHFINFSARTSANQTQDIIDSKLDKRYVLFNNCFSAPQCIDLLNRFVILFLIIYFFDV